MPKKKDPTVQKTRPDLADGPWIQWLEEQPENRGVDIPALFDRMISWCVRKGQQPTRRRLLAWLDNERSAVPISIPKPKNSTAEPAPSYNCKNCFDLGYINVKDPSSPYSWALIQAPCPKCSKSPKK